MSAGPGTVGMNLLTNAVAIAVSISAPSVAGGPGLTSSSKIEITLPTGQGDAGFGGGAFAAGMDMIAAAMPSRADAQAVRLQLTEPWAANGWKEIPSLAEQRAETPPIVQVMIGAGSAYMMAKAAPVILGAILADPSGNVISDMVQQISTVVQQTAELFGRLQLASP